MSVARSQVLKALRRAHVGFTERRSAKKLFTWKRFNIKLENGQEVVLLSCGGRIMACRFWEGNRIRWVGIF